MCEASVHTQTIYKQNKTKTNKTNNKKVKNVIKIIKVKKKWQVLYRIPPPVHLNELWKK